MKKIVFALLLLGAFGIWIMLSPPEDAGYLLLELGGKTVEMSLLFAALLILIALFLFWVCWWLLVGSVTAAKSFTALVTFGGSERAQKRTASGLIDFIEGNWQQAHKKLVRAAPKIETPLINYLAAARSAYEMGDSAEAMRLLKYASDTTPDSELAVALTQAQLELRSKDYDACLATLMRVKPKAPQNPVLLDLLRQVHTAREDWIGLEHIFERLRSYKIIPPQELAQLEVRIHSERLRQEGERCQQLIHAERLACLRSAWNKLPAGLQKNVEVAAVYAQQLALNAEEDEAEQLIRKALTKEWHSGMAYIYGRLCTRDIRQQLRVAEDWLMQHPQDPSLLLTLGRLSMRNELWGKARDYLKESLRIKLDPEVYAELARLMEHMGEHQRSTEYYQQGLGLTTVSLPKIPLPKRLQ